MVLIRKLPVIRYKSHLHSGLSNKPYHLILCSVEPRSRLLLLHLGFNNDILAAESIIVFAEVLFFIFLSVLRTPYKFAYVISESTKSGYDPKVKVLQAYLHSRKNRYRLFPCTNTCCVPRSRNAAFPSEVSRRFRYNGGQTVRRSNPSSKSVGISSCGPLVKQCRTCCVL